MTRDSAESARIEGVRPVLEALRAGRRKLLEVSVPEDATTPGLRELREELARQRIPLVRGRGSGVEARAEPFPEQPFEELLSIAGPRRLVALDRVTDVGNLGSIARSAEVAGFTGLLLELRHAPPIAAGALRASAGALEHLAVGRTPSLPKALALCRSEGLTVLVAEAGGVPLDQVPAEAIAGDLVWVFGSEDRGVRAGVRQSASHVVGVAVRGRIASLGVAAAAAHLLQRTAERKALADAAGIP